MGPIIPICRLALASALIGTPSLVTAKKDDAVNRYAAARLAEMDNRDSAALKTYVELYRETPNSAVLADRIFDSAIRVGDMTAALRTVRAQELHGEISAEAPLLLFADAFARKNWPMALLAADELAARSNFGFIAPFLRSWVNVAQRKAPDLPAADPQADPLFAFYANDQRIYLDLASGNNAAAKLGLRNIAVMDGAYVRDLMLRASPMIAAQGDEVFADALIGTAVGADRLAVVGAGNSKLSPAYGLSALHVRLAAALLEQNVTNQALVLARLGLQYAPDSDPAKIVLSKAMDANGLDSQALALRTTISESSYYWPQAIRDRAAKLAPDEAVALTGAATRRAPQSMALALLAAQSQEAAKDLTGAASNYRKIVDMAAKRGVTPRQRAFYHLLLASALDNAGNWAAAREALDEALALDPNNAQILNYLGYSLLERNELSRAVPMIRKAFQFAPESPAITDSMAWAHFQSGDFDEAVTLLERAAKASGNDLDINEHLGDAYWRSGRLRDARYAWGVASQTAEGDAAQRLSGKIDIGLPPR